MSAQPKPTGEWTVDSVKKLVGVQALQIDYTRIANRIANAHNAELADVTEKNLWLNNEWLKLQKQLAAEREKVRGIVDALVEMEKRHGYMPEVLRSIRAALAKVEK